MLCHGITTALKHLHDQGIDLNGQVNPRTVLVKRRNASLVPQVVLPEHSNAFNNQAKSYVILAANNLDGKQKDLVALSMTVYFVQTCCQNFNEHSVHGYAEISKKTETFSCIQKIHCATPSRAAMFRTWKNELARALICWIRDKIGQIGTSDVLNHPFF
jgi:hypothetical protein